MSIQDTPTLMTGLFAVVQAIFLLLLTPLFTGISRQIRAKMHSRQGPGIMQDYRDIIKLLKRQSVAPRDSGFIFRVMPYVLLGSMLLLAMALPVVTTTSLFSGAGDLIIILYIFALFRFFFSLSGLDTGSPFAGIGASRELTLGVLVEPILFLGLLVVALIAGSTNIGSISAVMSQGWVSPTATLLAMLACGFATFIEMGKIPFDVAEAEQELQEGPLTEYSGSGLALVKWGIGLKQVVVAVLFLSIFFPFGSASVLTAGSLLLALVLMLVKLLVIFVLASLVENSLARGRFLLTHHVTWLGFGVAALGFVFYLTGL
ncbi:MULTISPECIES: respiratory chain complex I subunit 1 family protein [Morganella]|uniref:Respiratory chain complex I subunit 1 family protein n=2 Tax=Morganella morganii TaxID=582 RepID=A0AAN5MK57_MORMO|nr:MULTISPECIES: respiratory chain complex I subunit 1 family protein [Morganella]BEP19780.1 respiratory chain complex I subunit 1 family protein [Morganella morganii subsp. sibonii]HAE76293.1 hydrogenase 3 membrane subunit [Morganella sp. (in: enterobacteria)]EGT3622950.1 hydrogenase 3 membrane subunit [Morganella morganii]EGT3630308.1 hydrogenase 3 membrane subunit [Morganella morganii]EGT3635515.1 hydrogenase 3 membrane subunit [Morganella morganii]